MASFDFDQAEGLRRMLAGPKPRIFTFLSATSHDEKCAMLVNLGASLAQSGNDVLLVDACAAGRGIAAGLDVTSAASLEQVAREECELDDAIQSMPQGFGVAAVTRSSRHASAGDPEQARRVADAFGALAGRADIVLVDAELGDDDSFSISSLASSDLVVQVSTGPESITAAYGIIKRLNSQLGRRPFSVLVTGASEKEAQTVYRNMALAANRYLAVKLSSMGSVPADEHLTRAARLGRTVVDAFPRAGASIAFKRLAEKFILSGVATGELQSLSANGVNLGL